MALGQDIEETAAKSEQKALVPSAIDGQQKELAMLSDTIGDLSRRLRPVLSAIPAESGTKSGDRPEVATPGIAEKIAMNSERIQVLRGRVAELISRLEV